MAVTSHTGGGDQVARVESEDFHRVFLATRDADTVLYRDLRKAMREAGKPLVADVKSAIDQIPSSGRYGTGVRAALKAGTRVAISTSARSAGIRIVTSPNRLPAGKRALARAMNRASFRHPLFGDKRHYQTQAGRPYFASVIDAHRDEVRRRIITVLEDTARQLQEAIQ